MQIGNDTLFPGGGFGRCKCNDGWQGPSCTNRMASDQCILVELPDATWMGSELEDYIEKTCRMTQGWQAKTLTEEQQNALEAACNEVHWKPHWISGGTFSVCGSWPRALWVARALGCKKTVEEATDWLLLSMAISVASCIVILGCTALWCRRIKVINANEAFANKTEPKLTAKPVTRPVDIEDGNFQC